MADLPTNLSAQWWKDHKAKTLKSTGFGEALRNLDAAKKKFDGAPHSNKAFDELYAAFDAAVGKRNAAEKACLPKIHDDSKAALKKYSELLGNAFKPYMALRSQYLAVLEGLNHAFTEADTELKKLQASLAAINNNYAGLEKIAAELKTKPDATKLASTKHMAEDFSAKVDAIETTIKNHAAKLPEKVKTANVDKTDVAMLPGLKSVMNLSAHQVNVGLPYLRKRHSNLMASLE